MHAIPVITIDGVSASGKGTLASEVATRLGFHYLDSGALFRISALACLRAKADLSSESVCSQIVRGLKIEFKGRTILLDGEDVSELIREESVGNAASRISQLPALRSALTDLEKAARKAPGLVADGRDMGTVIFPDATMKVFLTATPQARAERRYKQLIAKGVSANLTTLTADLAERDRRDRERAVAPCVPADDAWVLDNSTMSIQETLDAVLERWETFRES